MATYRPSFVDVSGFAQGITRGIEAAVENKRKQDILIESKVDEFLKNYKPDRLRDNDIPVFTNAFNSYKKAAIEYGKLNSSGAKADKLVIAKTEMDKSLNTLNDIYKNSATASNLQAEYGDYIKKARLSDMSIPQEVTNYYSALMGNDITGIDIKKIPSAFNFELSKKDVNTERLDTMLSLYGAAKITEKSVVDVPFGEVGKTKLYGKRTDTKEYRPVQPTINAMSVAIKTDNALRREADNLLEIFKKDPQKYLTELKDYIPDIKEENVTPEILLAYPRFKIVTKQGDVDYAEATKTLDVLRFEEQLRHNLSSEAIQRTNANRARGGDGKFINPIEDLNKFENSLAGQDVNKEYPVPDVEDYYWVSPNPYEKTRIVSGTYKPSTDTYTVNINAGVRNGKTVIEKKTYKGKTFKRILISENKGAEQKPDGSTSFINLPTGILTNDQIMGLT